jgi:predicted CopG family antitoxin
MIIPFSDNKGTKKKNAGHKEHKENVNKKAEVLGITRIGSSWKIVIEVQENECDELYEVIVTKKGREYKIAVPAGSYRKGVVDHYEIPVKENIDLKIKLKKLCGNVKNKQIDMIVQQFASESVYEILKKIDETQNTELAVQFLKSIERAVPIILKENDNDYEMSEEEFEYWSNENAKVVLNVLYNYGIDMEYLFLDEYKSKNNQFLEKIARAIHPTRKYRLPIDTQVINDINYEISEQAMLPDNASVITRLRRWLNQIGDSYEGRTDIMTPEIRISMKYFEHLRNAVINGDMNALQIWRDLNSVLGPEYEKDVLQELLKEDNLVKEYGEETAAKYQIRINGIVNDLEKKMKYISSNTKSRMKQHFKGREKSLQLLLKGYFFNTDIGEELLNIQSETFTDILDKLIDKEKQKIRELEVFKNLKGQQVDLEILNRNGVNKIVDINSGIETTVVPPKKRKENMKVVPFDFNNEKIQKKPEVPDFDGEEH